MSEKERKHSPEEHLASFIYGLSFSDIPEDIVRTVERAFVDTIGVTLAGSDARGGSSAMKVAEQESGSSSLFGYIEQANLPEAVFANATAGHALDFDDTALAATDGHPSVTMVAPLIAIGERERATGRDVLAGYVAGFETQAYLNASISPDHYETGWHATATLGTFGSAAATAFVLDLSAPAIRRALTIAASMPAGLKRNFGTETKPVHAGHAARSGVTAALLAADGVDADPHAVSGEQGFFDLYTGDRMPDFDVEYELGERWALRSDGIDVKKYPCCYYTHTSIYGTKQLVEQHGIESEDIVRVQIEASRGATDAAYVDNPETTLQAKFSMLYLVAYTVVNGTVDLSAFEEAALDDPAVKAVQEHVVFDADKQRSYDSYGASITVETVDGEQYERAQERPPGTHDEPLTDAELQQKFEMCATSVLLEKAAEAVYDRLNSLRTVEDVSEITATLDSA